MKTERSVGRLSEEEIEILRRACRQDIFSLAAVRITMSITMLRIISILPFDLTCRAFYRSLGEDNLFYAYIVRGGGD